MAQKLSILVACLLLCAAPGQALRLLHDVDADYDREFAFGSSKAAAGAGAAAEAEPVDQGQGMDGYDESEISRVEFEPELGASASYAMAEAPVASAYAAGPAQGPVAAAGSSSMKWWLPPSTIPSFPLLPNPGMPGMPMPLPGMPFHPISWGAPAPPGEAQPAPPAAAGADEKDPSTNEVIN